MTIKTETSLRDFHFWGGAVYYTERLTGEELDTIEEMLQQEEDDGDFIYTDTEINDFFWFEPEIWMGWICVSEELLAAREP